MRLDHWRYHAPKLGAPLEKNWRSVLTAEVRHRYKPFSLCFRIADDLLSEKRDVFIAESPLPLSLRKILLLITADFWGDYPTASVVENDRWR